MARINRSKLSHGTKMVPEHLNSSISDASTVLKEVNIQQEQIAPNKNIFYVNWNIPVIRSSWGETGTGKVGDYSGLEIPFSFILPPTQDQFNKDYHTTEHKIQLEEMMFSWDQNANPLAMTDFLDEDEYPALLYDGVADNYKVRIRIYEKTPFIISQNLDGTPENLIYQMDIQSSAFLSTKYRNNPLVQSNINVAINPYKAYIMSISFPDGLMHSYTADGKTQTRTAMLPSTNVRIKLSSKLLPPDIDSEIYPQNAPGIHYAGNQPASALTVPTWIPEDPIIAVDGGSHYGIQSTIDRIDTLANLGYVGGLTTKSDVNPNSTIKDFYGYDVICVPLFQGLESIRRTMIKNAPTMDFLPYVLSSTIEPKWMIDRRMIHISYPFIVHHVFCSVSFYANMTELLLSGNPAGHQNTNTTTGIYRPFDTTISREVGVFIGAGIRSDHYDTQQVAYCAMDNNFRNDYLVDKTQILGINGDTRLYGSVNTNGYRDGAYDTELWAVPLNYGQSRENYGFSENGTPFFMGQGNLRTKNRITVNDLPYTWGGTKLPDDPKTKGMEQWIEVRGKISDTSTWLGDIDKYPQETIVSRNGWYVYLVGKRALTF